MSIIEKSEIGENKIFDSFPIDCVFDYIFSLFILYIYLIS